MIKAIKIAEAWDPDEIGLNKKLLANVITDDRLRIVEWLRDQPGSHIQMIADELEKEIRKAGK